MSTPDPTSSAVMKDYSTPPSSSASVTFPVSSPTDQSPVASHSHLSHTPGKVHLSDDITVEDFCDHTSSNISLTPTTGALVVAPSDHFNGEVVHTRDARLIHPSSSSNPPGGVQKEVYVDQKTNAKALRQRDERGNTMCAYTYNSDEDPSFSSPTNGRVYVQTQCFSFSSSGGGLGGGQRNFRDAPNGRRIGGGGGGSPSSSVPTVEEPDDSDTEEEHSNHRREKERRKREKRMGNHDVERGFASPDELMLGHFGGHSRLHRGDGVSWDPFHHPSKIMEDVQMMMMGGGMMGFPSRHRGGRSGGHGQRGPWPGSQHPSMFGGFLGDDLFGGGMMGGFW